MYRTYGTRHALFKLNGLKSVATKYVEPMALDACFNYLTLLRIKRGTC